MNIRFSAASVSVLLALGFSAAAQAADGVVDYQCQSGKKVTVRYAFNKQGIPTTATASINGKKRTLAYDLNRSDDVDAYFKDKNGYALGTSAMDAKNYREQPIMIFSPKSRILFKDCHPAAAPAEKPVNANKVALTGTVSYMCGNDRRLRVTYGFNAAGVPVKAEVSMKGRKVALKYDAASSDEVDTHFKGAGYRLGTGDMNADNFRDQSIMVTAPNNQIAYKDCAPAE